MSQHFDRIAEKVWSSILETDCQALRPGDQRHWRLALTIVDALRHRHVSITPQLAATLALQIEPVAPQLARGWANARLEHADALWRRFHARLNQGAGFNDDRGATRLLAVRPTFTLFGVVEPLLREAGRELGRTRGSTLLLGDDDADRDENPHIDQREKLAKFEADLVEKLGELIDADETAELAWVEFWKNRGQTLHQLAVRPTSAPEIGALERAALGRFKPNPQVETPLLVRRRALARTEAASVAQMEGINGIRMTRNPDDLGQVLFSELVHPDWMFLDRWLNSGYLIKQRHARRERLRDVLVVTFLPGELHHHPARAWLCAAWLDTMARFTRELLAAGLTQSELRWIEGDAFERHRHITRNLNARPYERMLRMARIPGEQAAAQFHDIFFHHLAWLPELMDAHAPFTPLPGVLAAAHERRAPKPPVEPPTPADGRKAGKPTVEPPAPADGRKAARDWLEAAWKMQEDNADWHEGARRSAEKRPMEVDEFAHCIAFFMLPEKWRSGGEKEGVAFTAETLSERFTRSEDVPCQTIITWVPEPERAWQRPSAWRTCESTIDARPHGETLVEEGEEGTMAQVFNRLEECWLELLMTEMSAG